MTTLNITINNRCYTLTFNTKGAAERWLEFNDICKNMNNRYIHIKSNLHLDVQITTNDHIDNVSTVEEALNNLS